MGYIGRSNKRPSSTAKQSTTLHRLGIQAFEPVLLREGYKTSSTVVQRTMLTWRQMAACHFCEVAEVL